MRGFHSMERRLGGIHFTYMNTLTLNENGYTNMINERFSTIYMDYVEGTEIVISANKVNKANGLPTKSY